MDRSPQSPTCHRSPPDPFCSSSLSPGNGSALLPTYNISLRKPVAIPSILINLWTIPFPFQSAIRKLHSRLEPGHFVLRYSSGVAVFLGRSRGLGYRRFGGDLLRGRNLTGLFAGFAKVLGELDASHRGDLVDRGDCPDEAGEEIGGRVAIAVAAGVPDRDFVDLDVLDRLDLAGDDLLDFLDHQQGGGGAGVAVAALDQRLVAGGLAVQHLPDTLGLGLIFGEDGVGLAPRFTTESLGLGLRSDFDLALLGFLADHFQGVEALLLGQVLGLLNRDLGDALGDLAFLQRLGLLDREHRVVLGNLGHGLVLALDGQRFLALHEDALIGLGRLLALFGFGDGLGDLDRAVAVGLGLADGGQGLLLLDVDASVGLGLLLALLRLGGMLGDADRLFAVGLSLADGADLDLLGNIDLGLVDGLGGGLLADRTRCSPTRR